MVNKHSDIVVVDYSLLEVVRNPTTPELSDVFPFVLNSFGVNTKLALEYELDKQKFTTTMHALLSTMLLGVAAHHVEDLLKVMYEGNVFGTDNVSQLITEHAGFFKFTDINEDYAHAKAHINTMKFVTPRYARNLKFALEHEFWLCCHEDAIATL